MLKNTGFCIDKTFVTRGILLCARRDAEKIPSRTHFAGAKKVSIFIILSEVWGLMG